MLFPVPTNTGITGNVVVVGGGMSGAAVAKYLRLWGGTGVSVTLIEMSPSYTSNIMSNTVLSGQRELSSLEYTYATLTGHYGVKRINSKVTSIDSASNHVHYDGGSHGLRPARPRSRPGVRRDAGHDQRLAVRYRHSARVEGRSPDAVAAQTSSSP